MTTAETITKERVRELLAYDPKTGVFTRRVNVGKRWRAGSIAGTVNGEGYAQIKVLDRIYRAHRLAWFYMHGTWPAGEIDHINGDKLDNRIENLRDVSGSINCQNLRGSRGATQTGILGVTLINRQGAARPYRARITIDGKNKSLGCHESEAAAHAAYITEKRRSHSGCTI